MRKKIIKKTAVVVLILLAGFTFASKTLYSIRLPVVYTAMPRVDTVPVTVGAEGTLESGAAFDVRAGGDWRVSGVYVGGGDTVNAGDPLYSIDTGDPALLKKSKELDILRLHNRIDALDGAASPEEAGLADEQAVRRARAELSAELELAYLQLDRLAYPSDGYVYAEKNGTVFNVSLEADDRLTAGDRLMSVIPADAPLAVRFMLDAEEGADFGLGSAVSVRYYVLQNGRAVKRTSAAAVESRHFFGGRWEYAAAVGLCEDAPLMDMRAEVTVGDADTLYFSVVPASCVAEETGGPRIFAVNSRKGLFGDEFYVSELAVTVTARNAYAAAVDPLGYDTVVVAYASRPVKDGDTVRVEG